MHKLLSRHGMRISLLLVLTFIQLSLWAQSSLGDSSVKVDIEAKQKLLQDQAALINKVESELIAWRNQEPIRSAELLQRKVAQTEVDQAKLQLETRKVQLESIRLDITTAKRRLKELKQTIEDLNNHLQTLATASELDATSITHTKRSISHQRKLLDLQQEYIEQLAQLKRLAKERLIQAEQWLAELSGTFQGQQETIRQQSFEELQQQINKKRQVWEERANALRSQLNQIKDESLVPQAEIDLLETQLGEADDSIFLGASKLASAKIRGQLKRLDTLQPVQLSDMRTLKSFALELEELDSQLTSLNAILHSKQNLILHHQELIGKRLVLDKKNQKSYQTASDILAKLVDAFDLQSAELKKIDQLVREHGDKIESAYLEQKKKGLTERHRLPGSIEAWEPLVEEIYNSPGILLQISRNTLVSLWTALQQADIKNGSLLLLLSLAWSALCLSLGRLSHLQQPSPEDDFTHKASFVVTHSLYRNRVGLLASGLLIMAAWLLDIVPPGLILISAMVGIWFGARIIISISYWILKSPLGLPKQQSGLHRLIIVFTLLTSISSLGVGLGHLGLLSQELTDLMERAFMLLLLPPAYLALRIRTLLMETFKDKQSKRYWIRLLGQTGFAIPLVILAAAILGISGYINLGWTVAGHLGLFILVLTGWLIIRGLMIDLATTLETRLTERSEHSGFWIKGVIEPLHFLLRLFLLFAAIWILFGILRGDPTTGIDLKAWLDTSLFTVGETSITSRNLLGSLLLLVLVFYAGRWVREVTYGWLYGNIRDLGIRNSLSVFTQYTVVVIGLIIAMHILGINLTSLTVFAGALGVGIGFGLQAIANNFISGLILLVERPVRSKDWVTIGDKEGEVSQIGMRSVTVTTWDNQDVIIPNSDLVSNAFINWTRSNNMVRTVLFIGIHYQEDPHRAQEVIEEAVTMIPAVSLTPPPKIWLSEFGASSVDFRIHYYLDVKQFSRLEVKSQVLFAIWDALKEAGIVIPYPQQDVYIKEMPRVGAQAVTGSLERIPNE